MKFHSTHNEYSQVVSLDNTQDYYLVGIGWDATYVSNQVRGGTQKENDRRIAMKTNVISQAKHNKDEIIEWRKVYASNRQKVVETHQAQY